MTPILILMPCIVVTPRCPKTLLQAMMPAPHSFLPRTRPAWYNIVQFYWTVAIGIHYIPYHTILYHTVLHCTIPHNNHTQYYIWHGTGPYFPSRGLWSSPSSLPSEQAPHATSSTTPSVCWTTLLFVSRYAFSL